HRLPPAATLFPYTTLFRSPAGVSGRAARIEWASRGRGAADGPTRAVLEHRAVGLDRRARRARDVVRCAARLGRGRARVARESVEIGKHTSELQSLAYLVCR